MRIIAIIAIMCLLSACTGFKPVGYTLGCTGYQPKKVITFPVVLNSVPSITIPTNANWFFVSDSFAFITCPGGSNYYPGTANQSAVYYPGQTVIAYITSASIASTIDIPLNIDIRLGMYDITDVVSEPGWHAPGVAGNLPRMVGTFSYAPPYGNEPAMVINQIKGNFADRLYDPPLILVFTIPSYWTGVYQIGADFMFHNSDFQVQGNYQYHMHGAAVVN